MVLLWFTRQNYEQQNTKEIKHKQQSGQLVLKVLKSHTRLIDTIDIIGNETSQEKHEKRTTKRRQNRIAALGRPAKVARGVIRKL